MSANPSTAPPRSAFTASSLASQASKSAVKPKSLPVDLGKAIALLLNHHSRPLLFRHTYVLKNIVSFYSENDHDLDMIMDDIIAFIIMCRQVSLEQQVSDEEFDEALREAVAFSCKQMLRFLPNLQNLLFKTLSCFADFVPDVFLDIMESLLIRVPGNEDEKRAYYDALAFSDLPVLLSNMLLVTESPTLEFMTRIIVLLDVLSAMKPCDSELIRVGLPWMLLEVCCRYTAGGLLKKDNFPFLMSVVALLMKLLIAFPENVTRNLVNESLSIFNAFIANLSSPRPSTTAKNEERMSIIGSDVLLILSRMTFLNHEHPGFYEEHVLESLVSLISRYPNSVYAVLAPLLSQDSSRYAVLDLGYVDKAIELLSKSQDNFEVIGFLTSLCMVDDPILTKEQFDQILYQIEHMLGESKLLAKITLYRLIFAISNQIAIHLEIGTAIRSDVFKSLEIISAVGKEPVSKESAELSQLAISILQTSHKNSKNDQELIDRQTEVILEICNTNKFQEHSLIITAIGFISSFCRAYLDHIASDDVVHITHALLNWTHETQINTDVMEGLLFCLCDLFESPVARVSALNWHTKDNNNIKFLCKKLWNVTEYQTKIFLICYKLGLIYAEETKHIYRFIDVQIQRCYGKIKKELDGAIIRPASPDAHLLHLYESPAFLSASKGMASAFDAHGSMQKVLRSTMSKLALITHTSATIKQNQN